VLEQALEGGVKGIQLREKDLTGKELFILAEKTRRLCQRYEAALLINDRLDVALAVDAAGVVGIVELDQFIVRRACELDFTRRLCAQLVDASGAERASKL